MHHNTSSRHDTPHTVVDLHSLGAHFFRRWSQSGQVLNTPPPSLPCSSSSSSSSSSDKWCCLEDIDFFFREKKDAWETGTDSPNLCFTKAAVHREGVGRDGEGAGKGGVGKGGVGRVVEANRTDCTQAHHLSLCPPASW